jgi:signal peptidase I
MLTLQKPKRWIAVLLALLAAPLSMLYLCRPKAALFYFALTIAVAFSSFWLLAQEAPNILALLLAVMAAVHAYRIAPTTQFDARRPWYSKWYGLISIVAMFGTFAFLTRSFLIEPFRMPSVSMEPTLPKGSYLFVRKLGFGNYGTYGLRFPKLTPSTRVERGDLVVFDSPTQQNTRFVMRVVAIEGDQIQYVSHQLTVNGRRVTGDSVDTKSSERFQVRESFPTASYSVYVDRSAPPKDSSELVSPGNVYVLGDNRSNSYDSRYWGQLPRDRIVGRVVGIVRP